MKRFILIVLCVGLIFSITGCGKTKNKSNGVLLEDFINRYSANKVEEEYYGNNDLGYRVLYDMEWDDRYSDLVYTHFSKYSNDLAKIQFSFDYDEEKQIEALFVDLRGSALKLFKSTKEMIKYYVSVVKCLNPELSNDMIQNKIEELWNQEGETESYEKEIDLNDEIILTLRSPSSGIVIFQITFR